MPVLSLKAVVITSLWLGIVVLLVFTLTEYLRVPLLEHLQILHNYSGDTGVRIGSGNDKSILLGTLSDLRIVS